MSNPTTDSKIICDHCGDVCTKVVQSDEGGRFCCSGCRFVYELLHDGKLENYYALDQRPGISPDGKASDEELAFLDDESVQRKLLDYRDDSQGRVRFKIPSIHCSSCIWLLENLHRLLSGISTAQVDFNRKELAVVFDPNRTSLRQIVSLLNSIGYAPEINLGSLDQKKDNRSRVRLWGKIGVAAFCFANIMLLSFPDYLASSGELTDSFKVFFAYVSLILALPVVTYSASGFYRSALSGLRNRIINIDVPIVIGIAILFARSIYEVISGSGQGYADSLSGLVFFLLIGRVFQQKTYDSLSFDRDYKSYFPISVNKVINGTILSQPITSLEVGNRIVIRNREIIPADGVLMRGRASVDYSFVTGEAEPQERKIGDLLYAGGRQIGPAIEIETTRAVSQSYLTSLWQRRSLKKDRQQAIGSLADRIARHFTITVLSIAIFASIYWLFVDPSKAWNVATAVLIVSCPCALALSTPFTLGTIQRLLERAGFYLKDSAVIERLGHVSAVTIDKTGTLTEASNQATTFHGRILTEREKMLVKSLTTHSTHPLSRKINQSLGTIDQFDTLAFQELAGKGLEALIDNSKVLLGARSFVARHVKLESDQSEQRAARVYLAIDNEYKGYFEIYGQLRTGAESVISELQSRLPLYLLSGDSDRDADWLRPIFGVNDQLHFTMTPQDKLDFVQRLQSENKTVLMIGDGLNDAGALKQSDIGLSISEDVSSFSPACDGIIEGRRFNRLGRLLALSRRGITIIKISFAISFLYNIVGLSFAVSGSLSPLVAAILMPLSSISVVAFAVGAATWAARREGFVS